MMAADEKPGARDFDFLIGRWHVHNRRLEERLTGSTSWLEFPATLETRSILQGIGNIDQFRTSFDGRAFEGFTLRLFNPASGNWSLYWADNHSAELQPPLIGRFRDGRGEFFADDTFAGRPIRVRFIWSDISSNSAHWEQAFSADGGSTWETNWTMDFTRSME